VVNSSTVVEGETFVVKAVEHQIIRKKRGLRMGIDRVRVCSKCGIIISRRHNKTGLCFKCMRSKLMKEKRDNDKLKREQLNRIAEISNI
jgi:hypothetical protein